MTGVWSKRIYVLRKHWLQETRRQSTLEKAKCGKSCRRSRKLYPLLGITLPDGSVTSDPEDMSKLIQEHFASKWSKGREDAHCDLLHLAFAAEGIAPQFTQAEMQLAFQTARNKTKLDDEGVSLYSIELLASVQPIAFLRWLNTCTSSTAKMCAINVSGLLAGKTSTKPCVSDVRMILPQNCFFT